LCIMAFGKELYDHIDHKAWSNADAFATCLGGVFAFVGIFCWDFVTLKLPFGIY